MCFYHFGGFQKCRTDFSLQPLTTEYLQSLVHLKLDFLGVEPDQRVPTLFPRGLRRGGQLKVLLKSTKICVFVVAKRDSLVMRIILKLSVETLSDEDGFSKRQLIFRRHDIHHNDNQRNDTHHNDTQHDDTQHNDTQYLMLLC
jgi:hypothetical protein